MPGPPPLNFGFKDFIYDSGTVGSFLINSSSLITQKQQIRREMRKRRRSLSGSAQKKASYALLRKFLKLPQYKTARNIGIYLTNDGEINPEQLIRKAWADNRNIYLPVLHPFRPGHLWFIEYRPDSRMKINKYGITEPDPKYNKRIPAWQLDITAFPLVAFDQHGNRLGMGGGYYDRTFAFCSQHRMPRPAMFGLAHRCQEVQELPTEPWDISLTSILAV